VKELLSGWEFSRNALLILPGVFAPTRPAFTASSIQSAAIPETTAVENEVPGVMKEL
jgi:hypothetical protein